MMILEFIVCIINTWIREFETVL